MLTEQRGVQFPRSWQIPDGRSIMCSMKWLSADKCFIRLWPLVPNHCSQSSRTRPSGNLSCQSLILRSPNLPLRSNLQKRMHRRRPSGINPGRRSCRMALVSASDTTWDLAAQARRAAMHTSAPYPNPTGNHAEVITWHRSMWQRHADLMVFQMMLFSPPRCHHQTHQTSPLRICQCQYRWTIQFPNRISFPHDLLL